MPFSEILLCFAWCTLPDSLVQQVQIPRRLLPHINHALQLFFNQYRWSQNHKKNRF